MTNTTPAENLDKKADKKATHDAFDGVNHSDARPTQTAWLVSVRDAAELSLAAQYPVDIIDFKEPNQGPLSPVDPKIWHQADDFGSEQPPRETPLLSAALGEADDMRRIGGQVPSFFAFAKVGASHCDTDTKLTELWCEAKALLPPSVELVAVAYADHLAAECLPPERVFRLASEQGMSRALIDTFGKHGKSSVDVLGTGRLKQLSAQAKTLGLWWTLAGSIKLERIPTLAQYQIRPDCIGVRGDVCGESRTSSLSPNRLQKWSDEFKHQRPLER